MKMIPIVGMQTKCHQVYCKNIAAVRLEKSEGEPGFRTLFYCWKHAKEHPMVDVAKLERLEKEPPI